MTKKIIQSNPIAMILATVDNFWIPKDGIIISEDPKIIVNESSFADWPKLLEAEFKYKKECKKSDPTIELPLALNIFLDKRSIINEIRLNVLEMRFSASLELFENLMATYIASFGEEPPLTPESKQFLRRIWLFRKNINTFINITFRSFRLNDEGEQLDCAWQNRFKGLSQHKTFLKINDKQRYSTKKFKERRAIYGATPERKRKQLIRYHHRNILRMVTDIGNMKDSPERNLIIKKIIKSSGMHLRLEHPDRSEETIALQAVKYTISHIKSLDSEKESNGSDREIDQHVSISIMNAE